MQFHEALLQVYKVGAKIRAKEWSPDCKIHWGGKSFLDAAGREYNPDLNYCLKQDWEVFEKRQGPFGSFKVGDRVRIEPDFGKVLTVIGGHPKYNAVTSDGLCLYISPSYWVYHKE